MPEIVDCSIIMLAHNGVEFTRRAFENLLRAQTLPAEFVFADNGSTDSTHEAPEEFADRFKAEGVIFTPMRNEENLGCSLARNLAWEKTTRPYTVFMDNDTAVCTSDWLHRFKDEMDADAHLGVLGPKLIYPYKPHTIQCAGCAINPKGRVRFRGRGAGRYDVQYAQHAVVPVLISACWITRRKFLDELGGLDELFHPVQYEDLDFCMKVNQTGGFCAYTPEVEIYHFEGVTTASFGQKTYQRNIAEQSMKFKKRWMDVIRTYPEDPSDYRWLADEELGLEPGLELNVSLC